MGEALPTLYQAEWRHLEYEQLSPPGAATTETLPGDLNGAQDSMARRR
jgi:hypothetical protein